MATTKAKQPTKAVQAAMDYRMEMNGSGWTVHTAKDFSWQVFVKLDELRVRAFRGRAKKPAFANYFMNEEHLKSKVAKFIKDCEESKVRRKREERKLKVGDVVYTSWGYDQTNIDYYQVVALVGKAYVKVRQISKEFQASGDMCGHSAPVPDSFVKDAPEFKCLCDGLSIRVDRQLAWPAAFEEVAGVKVYNTHYESSYA